MWFQHEARSYAERRGTLAGDSMKTGAKAFLKTSANDVGLNPISKKGSDEIRSMYEASTSTTEIQVFGGEALTAVTQQ